MDLRAEELKNRYYNERDKIVVEIAKTIRTKRRLQNAKVPQGELLNLDDFADRLLESVSGKQRELKENLVKLETQARTEEAQKNQLKIDGPAGGA